jgi:hypothetical protein
MPPMWTLPSGLAAAQLLSVCGLPILPRRIPSPASYQTCQRMSRRASKRSVAEWCGEGLQPDLPSHRLQPPHGIK